MNRTMRFARPLAMAAALFVFGGLVAGADAAEPLYGLRVSGRNLVDDTSTVVALRGVNRSGTEYGCVEGYGIFDGPSDDASVAAIARWHINFVRVLLNEDCWLGINGIKQAYGGHSYRQAIVNYVELLHSHGIYAEVSLIWGAPGHFKATYQPRAPDADHSPAVWKSMARAFKNDPNVMLAPWGEPLVTWSCLLHGGSHCPATQPVVARQYRTAGMQQAVNLMRAAGYRGPIVIPGINYANDMSSWLTYEPHDPLHRLVAEAHVYGKNACSSPACFDQTMAPVAKKVPLIFGEAGETYDASECGSKNMSAFLHWADAHGVGYAAWTWDDWDNCHALIKNYKGTPAHSYGAFVRGYYADVMAESP